MHLPMSLPMRVRAIVCVGLIVVGILGIVLGTAQLPSFTRTAVPIRSPSPITWALLENLESGYALEYPSGSTLSQGASGTQITFPNGERIVIAASTSGKISIMPATTMVEPESLREIIAHMRASLEPLDVASQTPSVDTERFVGASSQEK